MQLSRGRHTLVQTPRTLSVTAPRGLDLTKVLSTRKMAEPRGETASFKIGEKVRHEKWGEGLVVKVAPDGASVEVAFPRSDLGIKKLLVEYAPLEKVAG